MKNKLLRTATFAFLAAAIFTACDSFQNSEKVKEQIVQQIEYANTAPYTIYVEAQKDSGIITKPAAGEAKVKPSDIINLSFTSETDYQFIKWEVYDSATGKIIEENHFLEIEDPKMVDTTCNFLKRPEDPDIKLSIRAIAAKRPQVILSIPTYQETGSPRNTNIQILFNHFNMDPNNIYYTKEEIQNLKKELKLDDSDFLKGDDNNCNGQYYGYKIDNKKIFKNIQIIYDPVEGTSLTQYFYDPYWAKEPNGIGGSTLIIQTTNPPPPKNVTFYITLSKDFCYFDEGIAVKLRETATLPYKTMSSNETIAPQIFLPKNEQNQDIYNVIKYKNPINEYINLPYNTNKQIPPIDIPSCDNIKNFTLSFEFCAIDEGGSGIANKFRLCCENPYLPDGEISAPPIELSYLYTNQNEAYTKWSQEFEYIIPRTKYLRSGKKYCFSIEAIDNDGNATKIKNNNGEILYYWLILSQNTPYNYN